MSGCFAVTTILLLLLLQFQSLHEPVPVHTSSPDYKQGRPFFRYSPQMLGNRFSLLGKNFTVCYFFFFNLQKQNRNNIQLKQNSIQQNGNIFEYNGKELSLISTSGVILSTSDAIGIATRWGSESDCIKVRTIAIG